MIIAGFDYRGRKELAFRDAVNGPEFSVTSFSELTESKYINLSCSYDGSVFTSYINGRIENINNGNNIKIIIKIIVIIELY